MKDKELELIKNICEILEEKEELINKLQICYIKKYKPEDILIEREKRVHRQGELIKKYNNTLLVIRVNYPGVNKNNHISLGIIKEVSKIVLNKFEEDILYRNFNIASEGPIVTVVIDKECKSVKYKVIDIEENHFLGRCVDIDVYDKGGSSISRAELGLPRRKCYICSDFAQNCVRSRKHSVDEVEKFINIKYEQFWKENYF